MTADQPPTDFDEMLQANEAYAASLRGTAGGAAPRVAIVTCMDARIDPWRAFGLQWGEAHVIRNAGGRVSEAIRSLVISQVLLGTRAVAVIHHTECGMTGFTDEGLREQLRASGADPGEVSFLPFADVEQSVHEDLADYRASKLVRQDVPLAGFVFDVSTGRLRRVE